MLSHVLLNQEESLILSKDIGDTIEIDAEFTHTIFQNDLFVIAAFLDDTYEDFSVLGNVPFELKQGRRYKISGVIEESYNQYRKQRVRQLRLNGIALLAPTGEVGIIRYLQSLKGLNSRAIVLYQRYKDDTLRMIKEQPERIAREIHGISLKQALNFQKQLMENADASEALTFLLNLGLSLNECNLLFKRHGESIKEKIEQNPYDLTRHNKGWPGFSFVRVDKLAESFGLSPRMPERLDAAIFSVMERQGDFGHCYSDITTVINMAQHALKRGSVTFSADEVEAVIEGLLIRDHLMLDTDRLYVTAFYEKEKALAGDIIRLAEPKSWRQAGNPDVQLETFLKKEGLQLEQEQKEAVVSAITFKGDLCILNGAAGTGKTFTADIILKLLKERHSRDGNRKPMEVAILAPTGKAAKVLKKALNYKYDPMTIHRALRPQDQGFLFERDNPLTANVYVIDETSMLDTSLAHALMQAIPSGSKVILLGDTRQLPAIGAGNVLADTIKSGVAQTTTLLVPKRQAKGSSIYANAKRILEHERIQADGVDTLWFQTRNGSQARHRTLQVVKQIQTYKKEDIQVLSPMKKGSCGTFLLNYYLQDEWNKAADSKVLNHSFEVDGTPYKLYFRTGDKVIQMKNNPDLEWVKAKPNGRFEVDEKLTGNIVTNGEQGVVQAIFEDEKKMANGRSQTVTVVAVQYDEGIVLYRGNEKQDLDHAYAISVHKAQGSQWPVVIQVMDSTHYMLLSNELFYTGYSRAEEKHILIADVGSVDKAVAQQTAPQRRTSLTDRLDERRKQ